MFKANTNTGSNTAGQTAGGGTGKHAGGGTGKHASGGVNSANQAITQAQSNAQNAACIAGTLTGPACNNTSVQGQY